MKDLIGKPSHLVKADVQRSFRLQKDRNAKKLMPLQIEANKPG